MTRAQQTIIIAFVCMLSLMGVAGGWFGLFDGAMRDIRFGLTDRPASGEIVFVEIDPAALVTNTAGADSRALYAHALDAILAEGAEVAVLGAMLDMLRDPASDAVLAEAFERSEGRARSITVRVTSSGGATTVSHPADFFAGAASPVYIDAVPDRRHASGAYETGIAIGSQRIEALALALSPGREIAQDSFLIDFATNLDTVPRLTLSEVLAGGYVPGFFEGKRVLIAPDSHALSSWSVPRYGLLTLPMIELLAAESVRQARMLSNLGALPVGLIVLAGALVFALLRPSMTLKAAVIGSLAYGGTLEFIALALQVHSGLLLDTAGIHIAQAGLVIAAFWQELEDRGRSMARAARERDSMRGVLERVIADHFDGVIVIDQSGVIRTANRLAEDLVGPGLAERNCADALPGPLRRAVAQVLKGEAMAAPAEIALPGQRGERIVEFVATLSDVGGAAAERRVVCLTFRDITERRRDQLRLTYLAEHDQLTGAVSRTRFVADCAALLARTEGQAGETGVYVVGLTRLKTINNTLGHAYGDALLRQVVGRLSFLEPVSVARLEGNTFAVLRHEPLHARCGEDFADRLVDIVSRPYELDGHNAIVGARVGMSSTSISGRNAGVLLAHACHALLVASDKPGNGTLAFSPEMDKRIKTKQDMEIALREALNNDQFAVHYQPQVDLASGEIVGVEALTRWTHPKLGAISPGQFIPAAEETGLIIELGRWVLNSACREVAGWEKPVWVSVNVSPLQFEYGDIVGDVRAALAGSGLSPERLHVEITEGLLVAETSSVIDKLTQLRAMGVGVALDDFGMGYSSLSYLGRLPVDTIKIDQSFVRGLPHDQHASAIVQAVLMLSQSLGKAVVAEGIETQDQAWLLRLAGCKTGQGYFFSRPAPAKDIRATLHRAEQDRFSARLIG